MDFEEFERKMADMELQMVPVLERGYALENHIPALVTKANGKSTLHPVEREGIVIRPLNEMRDPALGRVSFKSISAEFLLKHDS
jgi:hypothetical protein